MLLLLPGLLPPRLQPTEEEEEKGGQKQTGNKRETKKGPVFPNTVGEEFLSVRNNC